MEMIQGRLQNKKEGNEGKMLPDGISTMEIPVSGDRVEMEG